MNKQLMAVVAATAVSVVTCVQGDEIPSLWTARDMGVSAVNRTSIGTVSSVDLQFGAGNGLTNRLYLAYGETDGGDRIDGWSQSMFVGEVTDEMSALHVDVPAARNYKFFLDVPFPGNQTGVPVADVIATGTQYADTGVNLRGGDIVRCGIELAGSNSAGLFGTRVSANEKNICAVYNKNTGFVLDYNSSAYSAYRLTQGATVAPSLLIVLSADERSMTRIFNGNVVGSNVVHCADVFETTYPCWLFKVSGNPSVSASAKGAVSAFSIERGGAYLAFYLPYRFGEEYGFFDRVTGRFVTAVEGAFSGTEDASLSSPLTSSTETITIGKATAEAPPRSIQSCTIEGMYVDVVFGPDNGLSNKLYIAYGERDMGTNVAAWTHFEYLGIVTSETNFWRRPFPLGANHCRFFLSMPVDGGALPIALGSIAGDGTGYFDTGFAINGGDAIHARVMVSEPNVGIMGHRHSFSDANDRNVSVAYSAQNRFVIDYTGSSDYSLYRAQSESSQGNLNSWADILASAEVRSASKVADETTIAFNNSVCSDQFETTTNCWLFAISGEPRVSNKLTGKVASFKIVRDGYLLTSLSPCRVGSQYGFYDRVNGRFLSAAVGTFTGDEDDNAQPLFSVSDDVRINKGFILIVQ